MARRLEPGELFNKELEDTQLECQSVAEQRAAMEAMRDYAAAMYRAYAGRPWSPAKGSRASHVTTASQISALDFRSEEHTSELQSLMRISYAVFCLTQQKQ